MLRSGIQGSSENTKTNGVNPRGFCTDTFLNWLIVGLSKYSCKTKKKKKNLSYSIGRRHVFCLKISPGKTDTFFKLNFLLDKKLYKQKKGQI